MTTEKLRQIPTYKIAGEGGAIVLARRPSLETNQQDSSKSPRTIGPDKDLANEWNNIGVQHYESERYEEAIKCYDKAISIEPNDTKTWNVMGISFYEWGKSKKAI